MNIEKPNSSPQKVYTVRIHLDRIIIMVAAIIPVTTRRGVAPDALASGHYSISELKNVSVNLDLQYHSCVH